MGWMVLLGTERTEKAHVNDFFSAFDISLSLLHLSLLVHALP